MKKSFMTRVLATGLSVAMAFSLSAATNVTTASAAVKKASTTTFMKVATKNVTEGKTTTTYMNSTATKKYRIKSHTESSVAKKYISVVMTSGRKGLKITAKDGAVTNAGLEKKGVNVKINFAAAKSVAAVKKAKATKYVNLKVAVKAAEDEKVTMTAAPTGVKKITVTFNKAVDKTTELTLTKKSVKPAVDKVDWNEAGTEAVINTKGKLTEGTYTVSTTVAETPLTADAVVLKNETLTAFKLVGNTLKAKSTTETTTASIEYQALNQYEEPMSCSTATVTVAPGKVEAGAGQKTPTATANGKITVTDIPEFFTIAGSEFNVVIVDREGVTLTTKAVYGASAKAKNAEAVGLYNVNKGKIMDMTAGDKPEDYKALFTVTDQYGDPLGAKDVVDSAKVNAIVASALTNVTSVSNTVGEELEVDGKKYFAIPLARLDSSKTAVAGSFSLTLVNTELGTMGTYSYTVAENVVIASIDISADAIYAAQDNVLTLTVTDKAGNPVTSYDVLKKLVFSDTTKLKMTKNADGTAKLVYKAPAIQGDAKSALESFTVQANDMTSPDFMTKNISLTRLAKRKAVAVVGVSSKVANSTAVSGATITLKFSDLLIEDQYGNIFTEAELKADKLVSNTAIFATSGALGATASTTAAVDKWVVSGGAVNAVSGTAFDQDLIFTAPATHAAIKDIEINLNVNGNTNDGYKFKLSKLAKGDLAKITDLAIDSVNNGYAVQVTDGNLKAKFVESAANATGGAVEIPIVVSGKVNGKKVFITEKEADATISAPKFNEPKAASDIKNEKATLKVIVNTSEGPVTLTKEFDVSNENNGTPITIKKEANYAVSTSAITLVTASAVNTEVFGTNDTKPYKSVDKYGNTVDDDAASTTYEITLTDADVAGKTLATLEKGTDYDIDHNGMHSASFSITTSGTYTFHVVVTAADGTVVEYDLKLKLS